MGLSCILAHPQLDAVLRKLVHGFRSILRYSFNERSCNARDAASSNWDMLGALCSDAEAEALIAPSCCTLDVKTRWWI
jgi:hypothetical protein